MHKISNRIFEIFFKKTLDFLLAGFRIKQHPVVVVCIRIRFTVSDTGEASCPLQPFSESSDPTKKVKKSNCSGYQPPFAAKKTVQISLHRFRLLVSVL